MNTLPEKSESLTVYAVASPWEAILASLRRLDLRLLKLVGEAQAAFGQHAASDPFRGLYVQAKDVERLLTLEPGASPFQTNDADTTGGAFGPYENGSRLAWLGRVFGLSPFDLDVVVIAAAPEIDLRYERLYAYLQDDVSRTRPSVDLALNILCSAPAAKLARRAHFTSDAALVRQGIIRLVADPAQLAMPLLRQAIRLDVWIVRLLLEQRGLDERIARCIRRIKPKDALAYDPLPAPCLELVGSINQARSRREQFCLYFQGPRNMGKAETAEALAGASNATLLSMDVTRALTSQDPEVLFRIVLREAWLRSAVLYLEPWDALLEAEHRSLRVDWAAALAQYPGVAILAGESPWLAPAGGPRGVQTIRFTMPEFGERRELWRTALLRLGYGLEDEDLDALASRFRLTSQQIHEAVASAINRARMESAFSADAENTALVTTADLFEAARAQSGQDLLQFARKIEPKHSWHDLILPPDSVQQLQEICNQVQGRHLVLDEWGFGRKLSLGKGVNALFVGPPGTGKTTAAEILALDLGLDLYEIDLARVLDKYIGEMEKKLDCIFSAAEYANAILCFHEADALFGKRVETRDAHDLYANQGIAYLLQKIEQYEGVAILTTNMRQNMDEAFIRRLQFIVEFPFPNEHQRQAIWKLLLGATAAEGSSARAGQSPLDAAIDYGWLGSRLVVSGGGIQNIVLGAAYQAASNGGVIGMKHLVPAARREYLKMGKVWDVKGASG